ncbi:roadblock/LC7 domain-containing protein [Streptomyces sp. NPDC001709]
MTTPDLSPHNGDDSAAATPVDMNDHQKKMAWLLKQFVSQIPGVTHALLVSRDGIKLLDSDIHPDWADPWAAAFCGLASLAQNIKGPRGEKLPPSQMIIDRADCFFFLQFAGTSAVFKNHPGSVGGTVETVLGVITEPDAEVSTVGYEMQNLVNKFAPFMVTPVRQDV